MSSRIWQLQPTLSAEDAEEDVVGPCLDRLAWRANQKRGATAEDQRRRFFAGKTSDGKTAKARNDTRHYSIIIPERAVN